MWLIISVASLALVAAVLAVLIARAHVVAQPDEWLLCIRNGKLVKAGVGISLWRWPGDVVARFTSTVQRVSFSVGALSSDRLRLSIEGFVLWSVSSQGDGPFRAFQKLGLVNLDALPRDQRVRKHLLTTPQHHAFQQLLASAVQRLTTPMPLDDLLLRQDELVAALRKHLTALETQMGILVDQIEISQVRPADEAILRQLSARVEERLREEAEHAQLEAGERTQSRSIESESRIARERADARKQELEQEKAICLSQIEHEHEVKQREREIEREQLLALEARELEIAKAVIEREDLQLSARLDSIRKEAQARRDAISAVASAEEKKSQAVRDHELATLVAEKLAEALKELPLHEARWITIGPETPAGSLAALITAARELATPGGSKKAA